MRRMKRASVLLTHSLGNGARPLHVGFASGCMHSSVFFGYFLYCLCILSIKGLNLKRNPKKGHYYNRINSSKQKQINKFNNGPLLFRTTPWLTCGLNPGVSKTSVSFPATPPVASVMSPTVGQWPSKCPRADILPLKWPPRTGHHRRRRGSPLWLPTACVDQPEFPPHLVQSMNPSPLVRETEMDSVQIP